MLRAGFPELTRRQCEVLLWVFLGKTDPEIALILDIASPTASTHVRDLLLKLGAERRYFATLEVVRVIICRRPRGGA